MDNTLEKYLPSESVSACLELIKIHEVHLKIVNERVTRHGDYRLRPDGTHQITVNANLNPYRFLMTLIHELAHLVAYKKYGRQIKPHGREWKHTFQQMMLPFIRPQVFPSEVLPQLARHFKNPRASSDSDPALALSLKQYDPPNDKYYIFEVPMGGYFKLYNGRVFRRGAKRVKRFECVEVKTGRLYLFNPMAEVNLIQ
ncbi:SprT-like domain-containing protein [Aureitalea marina]|uniref:SprT domain-containing protein n=1 Tax=Aureitalea marina TaxID=930804 RepID=A0A2S7KQU1_9FLAO|nr:SprT-like domain-containing protein [Aureitalea marina]PQB04981.1 sprT domain-containing protein [Aureitalea marina]